MLYLWLIYLTFLMWLSVINVIFTDEISKPFVAKMFLIPFMFLCILQGLSVVGLVNI